MADKWKCGHCEYVTDDPDEADGICPQCQNGAGFFDVEEDDDPCSIGGYLAELDKEPQDASR